MVGASSCIYDDKHHPLHPKNTYSSKQGEQIPNGKLWLRSSHATLRGTKQTAVTKNLQKPKHAGKIKKRPETGWREKAPMENRSPFHSLGEGTRGLPLHLDTGYAVPPTAVNFSDVPQVCGHGANAVSASGAPPLHHFHGDAPITWETCFRMCVSCLFTNTLR